MDRVTSVASTANTCGLLADYRTMATCSESTPQPALLKKNGDHAPPATHTNGNLVFGRSQLSELEGQFEALKQKLKNLVAVSATVQSNREEEQAAHSTLVHEENEKMQESNDDADADIHAPSGSGSLTP